MRTTGRRLGLLVGWVLVLLLVNPLPGNANAMNEEIGEDVSPTVSTVRNGSVVVAWSRIVFEAAMTDDGYVSFMGTRHQAMMHIAMHDALNAIDPRFDQYAYFGRSKGANPIAAAAKAAHDVLVAVYPAQRTTLDAELATWLARVPDGSDKTKALTLGAKAAAAIVALRQNDGTDVDLLSPNYTPGTQPGDYQFVPPYDFTFAEDFRYATPFGLNSPEQFRLSAPPALTSRAYARAYNEVKSVGAINSTTRTRDQSNYANWWYEGSEIGWARIARVTTTSEELKLWRAARMFALVNMSLYDSYVAGWDTRFHWDTWRPYTAIRAGDTDGNRGTVKDATWKSYLETPPVQDYPSTHSALGAGAAEVLKRCFKTDRVPFSMGSLTALPANPVRSFTTFTQAANENADSRVRAGIHFRFATEQGKALGRMVGTYIVEHHLERR
ncbi:MAG: phosphoesterase PA-phosphatase related protein [Nocardioidaceae bacterium]|nr:phosphoesterase PA-phosphatase related protein [Nocardioidaceae bacterium]